MNGAIPTLRYISANGIDYIFRKDLVLLKILTTTPRDLIRSGKTFFNTQTNRNVYTEHNRKGKVLAMISNENEMVSNDVDSTKKFSDEKIEVYILIVKTYEFFYYLGL